MLSVHIHTTIPKKSGEILNQLAGTHGTKSRVLELALETLLRVDKVGSCEDCAIKAQIEEQEKIREALELVSVRRDLLSELLKIALADQTPDDFIQWQLNEAQNSVELIRSTIDWKTPQQFQEFREIIERICEITRVFEVASYREMDNTIVLRPLVFLRLPEIAAFQLIVLLEGIGIHFDLRIMRKEIIVKMLRRDLAAIRRQDPTQLILERLQDKLKKLKPHLFKDQLALIGPAFLKWASKNLEGSVSDLGTIIEDIFTTQKELSVTFFYFSSASADNMNSLLHDSIIKFLIAFTESAHIYIVFKYFSIM